MDKDIAVAKSVLQKEVQGIQSIIDNNLNDNFVEIINALSKAKGKLILSGIGKSGHIARKIAATLSSTGTSSFYIHPSEASHGDLGVITEDDILIILSNSGANRELEDIIYYAKQHNILLVSIVRKKNSLLEGESNFSIVLQEIDEYAMFKAPTTSTTMMLSLGDAIAMCLMERKKFTANDYKILHPGGKLGQSLMSVKKIMRKGDMMPIIDENAKVDEVIFEMTSKSLGTTGIINKSGKLIGIITDGDLRRHLNSNIFTMCARDIMTTNPKIIDENDFVVHVIDYMNNNKITSLFVVSANQTPIGVVHIHDLLRL